MREKGDTSELRRNLSVFLQPEVTGDGGNDRTDRAWQIVCVYVRVGVSVGVFVWVCLCVYLKVACAGSPAAVWARLPSGHGARPCLSQRGALGAALPLVVKEAAQQVDLQPGHHQHNQEVGAGPQVDAFVVALLKVAVAGLERPQDRLNLQALPQTGLHTVYGVLGGGERNKAEMRLPPHTSMQIISVLTLHSLLRWELQPCSTSG